MRREGAGSICKLRAHFFMDGKGRWVITHWHTDNIRYWRDFHENLHNLISTFLQEMELANNLETLFYTEFVIKYFAMK